MTWDDLNRAIANCRSEEDIRIAFEAYVRSTLPDIPAARYERSVRTAEYRGRIDALHSMLAIEYEPPQAMRTQSGFRHAQQQLTDYLEGLAQERVSGRVLRHEREELLSGFVGISFDGYTVGFLQRHQGHWDVDRCSFDPDALERMLLWVRSTSRRSLTPENLIADFGPQSKRGLQAVQVIVDLASADEHPKKNAIFAEWREIFGIIYGTARLDTPQGFEELVTRYGLADGLAFDRVPFALHTYYALIMKLLAAEIIIAQGGLSPSFLGSLDRRTLFERLSDLEDGSLPELATIGNVVDQDFFGWYPSAWSPRLEEALWEVVQALSVYDVGSFEVRPEKARDLFKDLYHGLVRNEVRHSLGEYYTPDWLAERTLDSSGYEGDPTSTILDPACGSGTFLVLAIRRIRSWLSESHMEWSSAPRRPEALTHIVRNVVGFDLPLPSLQGRATEPRSPLTTLFGEN